MNEVRELLAALAHKQWSGWMRHLFGKCQKKDDGSIIIPSAYVKNLKRLMGIPYSELSEDEKDSDREEADKVISALF